MVALAHVLLLALLPVIGSYAQNVTRNNSTITPVDGNQQLAAVFAAAANSTAYQNLTIAITFVAPGNMTTNNGTGRHLLQALPVIDERDNSYIATISILDAAGNLQAPPNGAMRPNGFEVIMDTGSANVLASSFNEAIAGPPLARNVQFQFGGGNGMQPPVLANEFEGTITFVGSPSTAAVAQFFSAPRNIVGLTFTPSTPAGAVPNPLPTLLTRMLQSGVIPIPTFTLFLVDPSNPVPLPNARVPGSQLTLGLPNPNPMGPQGPIPQLTNTDLNCAPGIPPINLGAQWVSALQSVTATQAAPALGPNNVNFCPQGSGCGALLDSGNFEISVPRATLTAVFQLLGLGANPGLTVPKAITGRVNTYAPINCAVQTLARPTLDFQIQDRVYSLAPIDYIFRYTTDRNGQPIPAGFAGNGFPAVRGGSVCAVVLSDNGPLATSYVLGDPFMAKFPSTFFGKGVIASTGSRGVPMALGNNFGGGNNGGPEDDVCIYGIVPVKAVCAQPITLQVTNPATCQAVIGANDLLARVSLDNKVAGFVSPFQPLGRPSTAYTLQPPAPAAGYTFQAGQTSTISLTATTPTVPVSVDTCQTTVIVPLVKPTAVCAPSLTLAATQGCAAHPSEADLMSAINAGSTPGSGGALTVTLNPPAPAGGMYNLPVGTYPISITVSNCAGSDTCSALVTVSDQELLDASKISCGTLPADGVVETPLLTKDKTTPVATYSSAYTKDNGCPTTLITDNLSCRNCLVGSNKEQQGSWDHCDSSITSKGVNIFPEQIGRVAWTVTVEDQADHEATADCAICADHGDKTFTTLGHCPKPFTTATPCDFGNL